MTCLSGWLNTSANLLQQYKNLLILMLSTEINCLSNENQIKNKVMNQ